MDNESERLLEDCFLRPLVDARTTTSPTESIEPHRDRLKTELQVLRISEEAQKMIMATLKTIHGPDFRLEDRTKYKDKGGRVRSSYWEDRGTLLVQSVSDYSNVKTSELTAEDQLRRYAIMKLESYGFPSKHCNEALDISKCEIDKALEFLYSKYMKYKFEKMNEEQSAEFSFTEKELTEMMEDEKQALESIYDKSFEEKEKNHVWSLTFNLDYLLIYSPSLSKHYSNSQKIVNNDSIAKRKKICRNILKGHCRFGDSCRFSHDIEEKDSNKNVSENSISEQSLITLEIRFPENTSYPYQPPMIFLKTNCNDLPGEILLRISRKLFREAQELAKSGMPSIYTISEQLQAKEDILEFLREDYISFPDADESLLGNDNEQGQNSLDNELSNDPTHYKMGSTANSRREKLSMEQILAEDKILIKKFLEKRSHPNYRQMLKVRRNLPAWDAMLEILDAVEKSPVVIISGETGCGKSTQVPQFILDNWLLQSSNVKDSEIITHCEIICTQPRRISTIGVAERVAEERNEKVGNTIGYQIRLENKISSSTRLTFCTTGILLQRLRSDPLLKSVTHIIVDEVHERSEESDFLLLLLKKILKERRDLKVILMSATVNAQIFSEYFRGAPSFEIPGRTFPVQQIFLEDILERCNYVLESDSQYCRRINKKESQEFLEDLEYADVQMSEAPSKSIKDENLKLSALYARYSDYSKGTCKTIYLMDTMKINPELIESILKYIVCGGDHDWPKTGAILIFLSGLAEIQTVHEALCDSKMFSPRSKKYIIIPLHSTLTNEEQSLVFQPAPQGMRKIILSTNIAETSVTIDDCVFVIDTGLMKEKRYDANKNMESLDLVWESRANAQQRKGRAGRVMSGVCIHLFTSNRYYNQFLSQPVPEIHRVPLEQLLLRIKTMSQFRKNTIKEFLNELIEPPTEENMQSAIRRLEDVGAFDEEENLTALGHHLSSLPVDVRIGKLLLFGAIFQCIDSVLTIAACLSHKSPFVSPFNKRNEADSKKKSFALCNSDHLTVLNAFKKWAEVKKKSTYSGRCYAEENFLSWRTLETIVDVKFQFLELLVSIGFVPVDLPPKMKYTADSVLEVTGQKLNVNGENYRLLISLLCAALYPNIVKVLTPEKSYTMTVGGAMPRNVQANELRFKTKEDGYVALHPSSVNSKVGCFQFPFLVYQEKVKTSRIFIRDCSMVPIFPLVFFSGSDLKIELHSGDFVLLLHEGWIMLKAHTHEIAEMVYCLRHELIKLLEEKIRNPCLNILTYDKGKKIVTTIVHLVSKE